MSGMFSMSIFPVEDCDGSDFSESDSESEYGSTGSVDGDVEDGSSVYDDHIDEDEDMEELFISYRKELPYEENSMDGSSSAYGRPPICYVSWC